MKKLVSSKFSTIYHTGNLEKMQTHYSSMEGCLLSCSPSTTVNDAWRIIAKLGAGTSYKLALADATDFNLLDFRALTKGQISYFLNLALSTNLICKTPMYKASFLNYDEDGATYRTFMYCDTKEDAMFNSDLNNKFRLHKCTAYTALNPLISFWCSRAVMQTIDIPLTPTAAISAIIEADYPQFDGIYWNDTLDISNYSAPRIGLFQRTVPKLIPQKL